MFLYARLTCVLTLGAMALAAQTVTPPTALETTAMVGIAVGQTARLNLFNPGVQAPATGVVCTAMVQYLDENDTVLKTVTVAVPPGKAVGVQLHGDTDLSLPSGARREIRATVAIPTVPPPTASTSTTPVPACQLVPTLELYDALTGRTLVILGRTVKVD